MTRLGLPENNMLIVQAKQMAAHILPMNIYEIINLNEDVNKNVTKLDEPQIIAHYNAINMALSTVGLVSLITANAYCNLGRFYFNQAKYKVIFILFFRTIIILNLYKKPIIM